LDIRTALLVLALAGFGIYMQRSAARQESAPPPAVSAQQQARGQMTEADTAYINTYMQGVAAHYRAFREGETRQTLRLPSGRAMTATITKTPAGYCPVRREKLYSINVSTALE
jgi:hypothetical protein